MKTVKKITKIIRKNEDVFVYERNVNNNALTKDIKGNITT